MRIRNAIGEDLNQIERIHEEMGMDYQFPDLRHPLFIVRKVAEGENEEIMGACCLRLAAECYLWLPPKLSPRDKVSVMTTLQPEVLLSAWSLGLDDIEARIPAEVEHRFEKRLRRLGWMPNRNGWHPWTVQTHA